MAKDTNQILGHGDDADGIEEYDNPLPDWWVGMFIITIIWAVMYGVTYHFIMGDSQVKQYEQQMADAALRWPAAEGGIAFEMDDELIAEGAEVFTQTCVACHAADLTGGIGANLVDAEWIHGGDPDSIIETVNNGVVDKGMPAWGPILGPRRVQAVVAFIVSKQTEEPITIARPEPTEAVEGTLADAGTDIADAGTDAAEADTEALIEVDDPIAAGEEVFMTNCVACHAADMTGGVGPNLIDDEWIHGSSLEDIRTVITEGVPAMGMISWGPILGDQKIDWVTQFVHSKTAE